MARGSRKYCLQSSPIKLKAQIHLCGDGEVERGDGSVLEMRPSLEEKLLKGMVCEEEGGLLTGRLDEEELGGEGLRS